MHDLIALAVDHSLDATAGGFALAGAIALYVWHSLENGAGHDATSRRLLMRCFLASGFVLEASAIALEIAVKIFGAH